MRQNNVDFHKRELRTNILARLLVTTRRVTPDDTQQHQEQTTSATQPVRWDGCYASPRPPSLRLPRQQRQSENGRLMLGSGPRF
jgi:hypothetical protein